MSFPNLENDFGLWKEGKKLKTRPGKSRKKEGEEKSRGERGGAEREREREEEEEERKVEKETVRGE